MKAFRDGAGAPVRVVAHAALGEHRGQSRLWIEGARLTRAGFAPGDRFTVTWSPMEGAVVIERAETGRTVSSRSRGSRRQPVIDVGGRSVTDAFGSRVTRVRLTMTPGRIVVEVHPDDAARQRREARLMDRMGRGQPLEMGSACHGGGILDHAVGEGLAAAGVSTRLAFAIEADEATLDAAAANNDAWDEATVMVAARFEEVDLSGFPEVDVVTAGLPCVGASRQGKAKNAIARPEDHPEAGHLFVALLDLVRRCNPAVVLLENVVEYSGSASATVIRAMLEVRGYAVAEGVVDGNAAGALEMRRRWCLVAAPAGFLPDLSALEPTRVREASVAEIMDDVHPDDPTWMDMTHMDGKAERDRAKGSNFSVHVTEPDDARVRTMGASYWRRQPTTPKFRHPTRPGVTRPLTPAEHARAKTVPEHLVAGLSNTLKHQILGNGVIHCGFAAVGRAVGRALAEG